jgi:hypothetical protein
LRDVIAFPVADTRTPIFQTFVDCCAADHRRDGRIKTAAGTTRRFVINTS